MPKGYIIAHISVNDPERYSEYVRLDTPILERLGAEMVVRGGRGEVVEGATGDRHVIMAFPSYEAALNAYHDPEYQEVAKIRKDSSTGTIIVAEGV